MSKISLKPNASGTGVFSLEAPNSNVDRTLTLPDEAGTVLTTTGDGSSLTNLPRTGLPRYSQLTLDSDESGDGVITNGFTEITSNGGYGTPASAVTETGGNFSFLETGYYKITYCPTFQTTTSDTTLQIAKIEYSRDQGSNFSSGQESRTGLAGAGYASATAHFFFEVTNTTNDTIRVRQGSVGGVGAVVAGLTYIIFEKVA